MANSRMQRVMMRVLAVMLVASVILAALSILAVQRVKAGQCEYCWNPQSGTWCDHFACSWPSPDFFGTRWECYNVCTRYGPYTKWVGACGCHPGCGACP